MVVLITAVMKLFIFSSVNAVKLDTSGRGVSVIARSSIVFKGANDILSF